MSESPSRLGDAQWIEWKLREVQLSRAFKRYASRIDAMTIPRRDREALLAIMLVEMAARGRLARALEWIITLVGRFLSLPPTWLPITLGPFQMRDAPFAFEKAVGRALIQIADKPRDAEGLARFWHGAAGRERGARIGYGDALAVALRRTSSPHSSTDELPFFNGRWPRANN